MPLLSFEPGTTLIQFRIVNGVKLSCSLRNLEVSNVVIFMEGKIMRFDPFFILNVYSDVF